MMGRCYVKSAGAYPAYGGSGVRVYTGWHDFEQFLADVGERPSEQHCIGRIDHSKGYVPGNVEWITITANKREAQTRRWAKVKGKKT